MPSTTSYDAGDIVVVNYIHTDAAAGGQRPVVVISTRKHNSSGAYDLVALQVSAQLHQLRLPGSVELKDWKAAGLLYPSIVKPVFLSYPFSEIRKTLGKLSSRDLKTVRLSVAEIFGFKMTRRT